MFARPASNCSYFPKREKSVLRLLTFLAICSFLPGALADQCSASKEINENLSATGISLLKVNALAGYLEIRSGDSDHIRFTGYACADEELWLSRMTLDIERDGEVLELTVMIPYEQDGFDPRYAHMNIELAIPESLETQIRDSSGNIDIDGVSITQIDDSSGSIRLEDNHSTVDIQDSSGDIELRDIHGGVTISDSAGDIDTRGVSGTLTISRDSSGDIDLRKTRGKVVIERDGSGNIDIDEVGDDVEIGSDGSGNITIRSITGNVTIGSDGSGGVTVATVSGDVTVNAKGQGTIRTQKIDGTISIPH